MPLLLEELLELVWQIKNDESHAFVFCTQQLSVPLLQAGTRGDKLQATVPLVHCGLPEVHANPPEEDELEEEISPDDEELDEELLEEEVVEDPDEELLELVWQIKNDESHAFVLCTQQLTVPLLHIGISGDKLHATVPPVHSGFPEVHANPPELLELEEDELEEEISPEDEELEEEVVVDPDDELLDEDEEELLDELDELLEEEELKQIILELKLPSEL